MTNANVTYGFLTHSNKFYALERGDTEARAHEFAGYIGGTAVRVEYAAVYKPDYGSYMGPNKGESRWFDRMVNLTTGETIREF